MDRTLSNQINDKVGEKIKLTGWVNIRRDHGKLIFIDLRDTTGKVQMVVTPEIKEAHSKADTVRPEWVVELKGLVKERPEKMITDTQNGNLEIEVLNLEILNESKTPPFEIDDHGELANEEIRYKHN